MTSPRLRSAVARAVPALTLVVTVGLACSPGTGAESGPGAAEVAPRVSESVGVAPAGVRHRVLAISVDGLAPGVVRRLGPQGAPTFHRLLRRGASTLEARTAVEMTVTLPNHTSMLTGRRIDAGRGGHGVTWNDDESDRVIPRDARGRRVQSIFTQAHRAGLRTALFAGKQKFHTFPNTWPRAIDRVLVDDDQARLVRAVRRDLVRGGRAFTFLHLRGPDSAGHEEGFGSPAYVAAVREVDRQLRGVLRTVRAHPRLRRDVVVVLTADHGGRGDDGHYVATRAANFRVPFLVWGRDVARGNLYRLSPRRQHPGRAQPGYARPRQPVRNGDLANLAADLLGLPAVPGSTIGTRQDLRVLR
ncbi:sulfatase-like hydrolase/transferase [Nocardioides sp. dk4132]|uniref:alkaline phosphatase family protein n=1 Tax=unclassified Nocardioides TaxID=2615069 RepID=UPI001296A224|nr:MULTISPECIES: alkaline phosphatase family protein [unclassified Nocardioides]MQW77107.1 sulfatase-like hydrolase/transferase [Nocardioides sp. dk4132]QGA05996.1 sulfatase-like hydrolase/transferase [Nocardioides sp. dk884]